MPFQRIGTENLDNIVNVRMTAAEKARLREDAELASLSVSEFVRRRSLGRPVLAKADAAVIRELRRLGGLVKHIHVDSKGAYSRDTAAALGTLSAYIERLSGGRKKG
jgi:hypothetical protein